MAKVSVGSTVEVLSLDNPELWLQNGVANRAGFRVELVMSHIEHGEQIALTFKTAEHSNDAVPVPSEWFWHVRDVEGSPSLLHNAESVVQVTVNGVRQLRHDFGAVSRAVLRISALCITPRTLSSTTTRTHSCWLLILMNPGLLASRLDRGIR